MLGARFVRGNRVGVWIASRSVAGTPANVEVDLMVPDAVGGPGRRAARLQGHAKEVARKTRGLEAALIDKTVVSIHALEPADPRAFDVAIAGPAALLIAKAHKIVERVAEREQRRLEDKDALDILRLLQATETAALGATANALLRADVAREVTREALGILREHFTDARAAGPQIGCPGRWHPAAGRSGRCIVRRARVGSSARDQRRQVGTSGTPPTLPNNPESERRRSHQLTGRSGPPTPAVTRFRCTAAELARRHFRRQDE